MTSGVGKTIASTEPSSRTPRNWSDDAQIGEAVRVFRCEAGMSQLGLVRVINGLGMNWHATTVQRIEQGNRSLRAAELLPLAAALATTPERLLGADLVAAAARVKLQIAESNLATARAEVERLSEELAALEEPNG